MSAADGQVVVIGGGVIGAACAHYLARAGCPVTLIDRAEFGGGCSHGNCGYICPSHVLPLAAPGALKGTLKTLLQANSPLKVRWRLDPALWSWFWRFARKCNQRDMLAAAQAIHALLQSSRALYDDLLRDTLSDVEWSPSGLLFVLRSAAAMEHFAATDELLRREFDLGATRYDGAALNEFEPALLPGLAGGWHYSNDGHLRPDKLMGAWRRALVAAGVDLRERCALVDWRTSGARIRALATDQGEIAADQVVLATGAWTPQLRRLLGRAVPIEPGKGYSLTMPRPEICPRVSMIFEEHRVAVTPLASAYRLGSTMEFAGYDARLRPERVQLLRDGAAHYLRAPTAEPVLEQWCGWRPMTPDSLPYLGHVPPFSNLLLAAGHGMLGVSMAPATGKLVAELLTGQAPHLDPAPYAVTRR
jgi:D-amino-acid dehydrogenase